MNEKEKLTQLNKKMNDSKEILMKQNEQMISENERLKEQQKNL